MKRLLFIIAMITSMVSANAMNYRDARREALFLTDKMAYELGLNDAQYEAVYEINLDYLMSIDSRRSYYGNYWKRRNSDLRFVLDMHQYDRYLSMAYFYRPVMWNGVSIYLNIYDRYARHRMFRGHPVAYKTFRGGFNRGKSRYEGRIFRKPAPPRHGWYKQKPTPPRHGWHKQKPRRDAKSVWNVDRRDHDRKHHDRSFNRGDRKQKHDNRGDRGHDNRRFKRGK